MKVLFPNKVGRVSVIRKGLPPPSPSYFVREATADQEADIIAGKTWWIPVIDERGIATGEGILSAPAPQVPATIANWRAKAVIELHGLTAQVEAALAAMEGEAGITARAAWNGNADFARHGATVTALASTLSLSSAQLDAMFIQAAALEV